MTDRRRPSPSRPPGPWGHLLSSRGTALEQGVADWFDQHGVLDRAEVVAVEGGPVHGYSPSMMPPGDPDRLTVLVVSPFPGADQTELHTTVPHPDLVTLAERRHVRITRVWDLVVGQADFARRLTDPGEGGFLPVSEQ